MFFFFIDQVRCEYGFAIEIPVQIKKIAHFFWALCYLAVGDWAAVQKFNFNPE